MGSTYICYYNYLCHHETCCHIHHNSWWVYVGGEVYGMYETKGEAEAVVLKLKLTMLEI